ncbi:MAG TPA: 5'/3'-nucleotidase SurE [Thermoanaerobaculia bacterium]|nr:5'/3'-nucleotidase SurE [Thermoanaerobaculia bacterium]
MTDIRNRRRTLGLTLVGALLGSTLLVSTVAGEEPRRRILVTNDDGVSSTALAALVTHLTNTADVIVVAPAENQSFAGRAKTIPSGQLRVREVAIPGASAAYAIEGTPVDAVHFGIAAFGAEQPFDAVVAGINQGTALGYEATSIGVVGAALEAAALGLPAIAVTQDRRAHVFDVAANLTLELLESWLGKGLPDGVALSINVPGSAADRPRGVVVARLGQPEYAVGGFRKVETGGEGQPSSTTAEQLWRIQWSKVRRPERETDLDWYQRGEITITPLRWDSTATDALPALGEWQIQAPARTAQSDQ